MASSTTNRIIQRIVTVLITTLIQKMIQRFFQGRSGQRTGNSTGTTGSPVGNARANASHAGTQLPSDRTPVRDTSLMTSDDSPTASYSPQDNGEPDPGEVVWTWVSYEDDPSQGKDRPVLLLRREGDEFVALPLTSKDHDRDAQQEAAAGRLWMDIGSGAWDSKGRPSEVRLNRVLRIKAEAVRREGNKLDKALFDAVVAAAEAAN